MNLKLFCLTFLSVTVAVTVKELIEYVASRDVLTEEETKMFEV